MAYRKGFTILPELLCMNIAILKNMQMNADLLLLHREIVVIVLEITC